MNKFDYLPSFYAKQHSPEKIIQDIDALLSAEELDVRFIPFGCERKKVDWLDNKTIKDRSVKLQWENGRLHCFELQYKYKERGQVRNSKGQFFILQDDQYADSFVAFTIESSDFYRRALFPFIQSIYPLAIMTFITHKKLRRLIDNFIIANDQCELLITRASQRLRFQENHKGRRVMPVVSWPSMSVEEAFRWVYDHNGWFESISIEVSTNDRILSNFTFTRQGILRTNALVEELFNSFIKPICKTIHEYIEFFSHRSRLDRIDLSTRPIVIEFEENQFSEVSENQRLIQSMRRMKAASISVLHGNPYVHLTILDYIDGSAFDLWVLDQQKLVLVPQLKVSVAAIKRLVNHVFDDYAEGNLINYEEVA
jgi:hypothetical protein